MSFQGKELSSKMQRILVEYALERPNVYPREIIRFNGLSEVLGYVNDFYKDEGITFTEHQLRNALLTDRIEVSDRGIAPKIYFPVATLLKGLYKSPEKLDEELREFIAEGIAERIA